MLAASVEKFYEASPWLCVGSDLSELGCWRSRARWCRDPLSAGSLGLKPVLKLVMSASPSASTPQSPACPSFSAPTTGPEDWNPEF